MAINRVSSILAADFGSSLTRVVLFDVVDGEYRVVAHASGRTTQGYPDDDLNVGLRRLLSNITKVTGRQFYNQIGRVVTPEDRNRNGVDYFITTASAGRPIRAIVVGLVPEISITSALRAMSGTYVETVAEFHLRDGYSEEDRLNAIILGRPDLIFVAGGTNDGAVTALKEILGVVELGLKIQDEDLRPPLLYAGNKALQGYISETFGDLTEVLMSGNIRPKMERESFDSAQAALGKAYDEHRETHGVAFGTVGEMSSTGILPTAQSYGLITEYYAQTHKANIVAMDIGSTSAVLAASFHGQTSTQISTTKGLGQSAVTLIDDVGEDAIAKWLPYYPTGSEIRNYALNKLARPASIPMNERHLFMEQAMIRTAMRQMVEAGRHTWKGVPQSGLLPHIETVIVGGSALQGTGNAPYDMMLIADCLQPVGITEIKVDRHGVIPAMSAIARVQPDAAVQIMDGNSLEHMGTLISLEGQASGISPDTVVATMVVENIQDEETGKSLSKDITVNSLFSLPVPLNFELKLRIKCKRGFKINGKSRLRQTIFGTVLIDARGRSFDAPLTVEERMRLLPQWIADASDDPVMKLPAEWATDSTQPAEVIKPEEEIVVAAPQPDAEDDLFEDFDDDDGELAEAEFDPGEFMFDEDETYDEEDDDLGSLRDLLN